METKISTLHRGLLWLETITGIVFGLAYYFVPGPANTLLVHDQGTYLEGREDMIGIRQPCSLD